MMPVWLAVALISMAVWLGAGIGHYQRQMEEREERKQDEEENGEWS